MACMGKKVLAVCEGKQMKNPIIKKIPADRLGEWPSKSWEIDMRDDPEGPDDPSAKGWVFDILAKFGKTAPSAIQGPQYCRWFFDGFKRHEAGAVKAAFINRCHKEGVTFIFIFRTIKPMSTDMVRMIEEFNASLKSQRDQLGEAA